jgi:hypothetical protein
VDTGGKSIHSYWVFDQPIDCDRWCELQKDLLEYADADRSIKNPARVMRLAGAWHISMNSEVGMRNAENGGMNAEFGSGYAAANAGDAGQNSENGNGNSAIYQQSHLISESGQKYSFEDLRSLIPHSQQETALPLEDAASPAPPASPNGQLPKDSDGMPIPLDPFRPAAAAPETPPHYPFIKHPDEIQIPVPEAVPLLSCCRKEVRDWVANGVPQGSGRNDAAIEVALELIAVERHLQQIGQPFSDSARQLFAEFCQRSGMTAKENEERWNWCEPKNPTPSCGVEGIEACIRGWYWRESQKSKVKSQKNGANSHSPNPKSKIQNPKSPTVTGDTAFGGDTAKQGQLSISATVATVTMILKAGLKDYEERAKLDDIQVRSSISKGAFWELVASLRCAFDEVQPEDVRRLNQLLDWHEATLDLTKVLPPPLARSFQHDGEILNIDPISLWQYFLPASLSLAGKRVNLDVESHIVPAICWACVVGESGAGKSRAENVILAPLKKKQVEERQRYEASVNEHKQLLRSTGKDDPEPPPPTPERKYLFEVGTIQSVMRRLSEQADNGSLWARDELAGLFKSLGQFSKSNNDNEGLECLLRMWDGGAAFVERMDSAANSYVAEDTRLNIAGGIQPQAFRQAFKDPNDPQGLQARFLYAVPQIYPAKRVKGYCELSDILPPLYDWLANCPTGTIRLSGEADGHYTQLVEQIGQQAESSANPAIRAWMRKLPGHLLRVSLALHLIECYYDPSRNFWELQRQTLERAADICRYYRNAFQVVQEKSADSDSISSILLKIWDLAATQPDGLSPRDIYRAIKAISRRADELGRRVQAYTLELLGKLVEMGKGFLQKNGRFYRFFANFTPPANPPEPPDGSPNPGGPDSPTPPPGGSSASNSETLTANFMPSTVGESPVAVTVVTVAENHAVSSVEASPPESVSPVTVATESVNQTVTNLEASLPVATEAVNQTVTSLEASLLEVVSPVIVGTKSVSQAVTNLEASFPVATEAVIQTVTNFEASLPVVTESVSQKVTNFEVSFPVATESVSQTVTSFEASFPQVVSPVTGEINNPALTWLFQLLEDLETGTQRFTSGDGLAELLSEAEAKFLACQEPLQERCPDYWERVMAALILPQNQPPAIHPDNAADAGNPDSVDSVDKADNSDRVSPSLSQPTLEELKVLLLACHTLSELKNLKQRHGEPVDAAYRTLLPEQQQAITLLAATAVPYEVSYQLSVISEQLSASISSLITGCCSLFTVKGWQQAVSVSRHCLSLVEKALSAAAELAEPETGNLLDGLT